MDSVNMAYRDEGSILDKIFQMKIFSDFNYYLSPMSDEENEYLKKYSTLQQGTHKIVTIKIQTYFLYIYIFGLKCCLHP